MWSKIQKRKYGRGNPWKEVIYSVSHEFQDEALTNVNKNLELLWKNVYRDSMEVNKAMTIIEILNKNNNSKDGLN